jgi:hypothetical protein
MYAKSSLPMNKELLKYNIFGQKEIEDREQRMGKLVEELWRV